MSVIQTTDYGNGYTLDQLENERGELYYRACKNSICRYAEDHCGSQNAWPLYHSSQSSADFEILQPKQQATKFCWCVCPPLNLGCT
jgi:hypothetical protein